MAGLVAVVVVVWRGWGRVAMVVVVVVVMVGDGHLLDWLGGLDDGGAAGGGGEHGGAGEKDGQEAVGSGHRSFSWGGAGLRVGAGLR